MLQIPVAEMEDWIVNRTRYYDPSFVSDDPEFRHAHITVLAPMIEWHLDAIGELAESVRPFDFELDRLDVFSDGTIYLHVDPVVRFKQLTAAAWQAHRDVRPFGGDDPLPHLTLDRISDAVGLESTARLLNRSLPIHGRAESLELVWYRSNQCHLIRRWPLSG